MSDPVFGYAPAPVQNFYTGTVQPYGFSILLVFVLVILYMWWTRRSEGFNPTQTMYATGNDQLYVGDTAPDTTRVNAWAATINAAVNDRGVEGMDGNGVVTATTDPASALMPGSPSWVVLNNPSFACNSRDLTASADYRAYQQANIGGPGESMTVSGGFTEQQAVAAMSGN